jgi:hypothetical protein
MAATAINSNIAHEFMDQLKEYHLHVHGGFFFRSSNYLEAKHSARAV